MDSKPQFPLPQVLAPAPNFEQIAYVHGAEQPFQKVKLSDYKGKYVVLFFYPLDFTFVCPTEIVAFSDIADKFAAKNTVVIGASVDSQFSHMEWCKKSRDQGGLGDMKIPIIADVNHKVSEAYGCLVPGEGITFRATYIIDDKGILRHLSVNDTPVGRNVDEIFRLVKAFQWSDKHGEVCPAKWDEGQKTMKTDHNAPETQDYWKNVHASK
jgi:alkyl hydroperoxide reductase subunit AhpC